MGAADEVRGLMLTLEEALEEAELQAIKAKTPCDLDQVLEIAARDSQHPSVAAVWRDTSEISGQVDMLFASRKVAALVIEDSLKLQAVGHALVIEDSLKPQAVGHALVLAACGGYIHCVRRLREIQRDSMSGSTLVTRFNAFAFLKAAENGHQEVIRELLRPMMSASTAMMGYVVAMRWKDRDHTAYPFVKQPANIPGKDWLGKLASTKSMLPPAAPVFGTGGWDLKGMPGVPEELHDCIRATYSIFLLWRAAVIAAAHCHVEVFKVLLRQRALENTMLADSFHDTSAPKRGFDTDGKKIVSERAKMDTLMYQLVEELSTKNYHDGILYALWGHIQRGGRDSPRPEAGRPRCVAQATNGLWEMQLEVPLLMMPVEHALQEEQPFRRYKQLTQLFGQRAKVNIQLTASVEALPNCLQVVVGIKHVRFKVESSRWDVECMGHFPSLITLAVTPVTKEGTGVTMTNSSSNILVKVGKMERIQLGTSVADGATRGVSGGMGAAASLGMSSTMKNKPWRFEQLPLKDERGGSFVWTLQSMKGVIFDRSNPMRMAERNSMWRFGRRLPSNPLDELPFTSEGGVIFTSNEFDDTMMWRFPKSMENKKMRWSIEGQIHSTYTTTRYFETRMASFCGDIEEPLKPLEVKDKAAKGAKGGDDKPAKADKPDKGDKGDKADKPEKGDKGDKGEKAHKGDKADKSEKGDKGEKAHKGDKADKPEKADKGDKSEKGDKGEKGEKAHKGDKADKPEKGDKGDKGEKAHKGDKADKPEKADKGEKAHKISKSDIASHPEYTEQEFLEFLEFRKFKERLRRASMGSVDDLDASKAPAADKEMSGFVVPQKDILGNQVAIEIMQRSSPRKSYSQPQTSSSDDFDSGSSTPAATTNGNVTNLDGIPPEADSGSFLWGRRVAASRDDDDGIISRSGSELNSSSRRIAGLSVRTRSGNLTNLGR